MKNIMRRNSIFWLTLLILLLQFPGFPHDIVRWVTLVAILLIIFLLAWSKRAKSATDEESRAIPVVRKETEGRPTIRVEKES